MNKIETIKQTLTTQWNQMRIIRLAAGLFFAIQAVQLHDVMTGFISAILLFQTFTNTGCCGVGGCAVPTTTKTSNSTHETEYEEIKNNK
jgi:hypothetical protein